MNNTVRLFSCTIGLLILLAFVAGYTLQAQHTILNNSRLRMGNGSENSVNGSGNLQQPFYYNSVQRVWRKLTYSFYPLDNAFAVGGDKTNDWNINGTISQNPALSNQGVNTSGFILTDASNGYGTIVSKGRITVGTTELEIENSYTLPQNSGYIEVKVKVTNVSSLLAENVRIWIGTRDDWVGNTDGPRKQRGNLIDGEFVPLSETSARSAALKVFTGDEAILFYTNSTRGNTIVNSCCSWTNVINQNPATSTFDITNDGSYGFYVLLNDLAPGASDDFTWYYAAGELADINDIIREVASVSGALSDITSRSARYKATSSVAVTGYWMVVPRASAAPAPAQVKNQSDYDGVVLTAHGSQAMPANTEITFDVTGLNPATEYSFYFVTEDETNQLSEMVNVAFATHEVPAVSVVEDVTVCQDKTASGISFTVSDAETAASSLVISVTSNNTSLVPNENITVGGSGESRVLSIQPAAGEYGVAEITISVRDADGEEASASFQLNVSRNEVQAPAVSNVSLYEYADPSDLSTLVNGANLLWYAESSGGSGSAITPVPTTGETGVKEFWVSQSSGGCESGRSKVTVTIEGTTLVGNATVKETFFAFSSTVDAAVDVTGSENLPDAMVKISSGYAGGDQLTHTDQLPAGVSASFDAETGFLMFTGTASAADWETVFRSIRFHTSSTEASDRVITFSVGQGLFARTLQRSESDGIVLDNTTIDEGAEELTPIGVLTTPGADDDLSFTYEIDPTYGDDFGLFVLENNSLKISGDIDYEVKQSLTVRIKVTDNFGNAVTRDFVIAVANLNDTMPVIDPGQSFSVPENSTGATVVGTVTATDADGETAFQAWHIAGGNDGGIFMIDNSTGEIRISDGGVADYEQKTSHELVITVSDGVNTSAQEVVTVNIENLNDTKPVVFGSHVFRLDENSARETVAGVAEATDPDGETVFEGWQIHTGNTGNAFSIDPVTGSISVLNPAALDYEQVHSFQLGISVSDGENRSEVSIVTIELNNLNDTAPHIEENQWFSVVENSNAGSGLGSIKASDADGDSNLGDWSVTGGEGSEAFSVDPLSGELILSNPSLLDFEGVRTYTIVVQVSDGVQTTQRTITITIENENDNSPTDILLSEHAFSESVAEGTIVGVLSTSDDDGEDFHTYALVNGDGSTGNAKFRIEDAQLFTNGKFDFDYEKTHSIRVRSTDSGGLSVEKVFVLAILQDGNIDLAIPTAFSPNGDYVNDTWELDRLDAYPNSTVRVFNSDGLEVFSTTGNHEQWNGRYRGKDLAFGTYYYVIRLNGSGGKVYKGSVMLIR